MIDLKKISRIKFAYYDENGYVYHFIMLEKIRVDEAEVEFTMICENTNTTANGAVYLILQNNRGKLSFRTDYFANAKDFIPLSQEDKQSNQYFVNFGKDVLELELSF